MTGKATPGRRPPLKEQAKLVGTGLLFYAATYFAGAFFGAQRLGAAGVQAAIAEWSTGSLGVTWSDPHAPAQTLAQAAKRALRGTLAGLAAAAAVIALALATHAAHASKSGVSLVAIATSALLPALVAVRDELFLRGLVLRVLATSRREAQLVACGLASIASALGAAADPGLTPAQCAIAGLTGVAFGALWQRDRGAWMAWGAHAAWLWGTQAATTSLDLGTSAWAGGDAGLEGGVVALPVTAIAAVTAVIWAKLKRAPDT